MFLIFLETYCREAEAPCLKHCRAEPEAFTKMNHWPSLIFLIQIAAISKQDSGLFTFRFWWRDESDGSYVFIGRSGLFLDLLRLSFKWEKIPAKSDSTPTRCESLSRNELLSY